MEQKWIISSIKKVPQIIIYAVHESGTIKLMMFIFINIYVTQSLITSLKEMICYFLFMKSFGKPRITAFECTFKQARI